MTTTLADDLSTVLSEVTEATRQLRRVESVPSAVEELVESFDARLHADSPLRLEVDPYLSTALFAGALRAMKALRHDNAVLQRRDLRIALEQVRHALRDIAEGTPVSSDAPVKEVLAHLLEMINSPQSEVADLLEVSTRQLQRWADPKGPIPGGEDEARIRALAQVVTHLRHVFTAPGVLAWFRRPHPRLGKRSPADLLSDPVHYPELRALAAASRTMSG